MNDSLAPLSENDSNGPSPGAGHLIHGKGEIADLIRKKDWSSTDLGLMENWPEALLNSLNLALSCAFPMLIFWGPRMVQFYNEAFAPLLSGRHPDGLGMAAQDFWAEAWHLIGPRLERVLRGGETIYQENEIVPILRDGRLREVHWTYNYSPIFATNGHVQGVMVVCHDITNELSALQELKSSENRASRILQSIGDAVIVTDAETRVARMNSVAIELTGWSLEEATGRSLSEVFHILNETTRRLVESPADKVKRTGGVVGLANHTVLIAKDGRETSIDDSGAPIFDDDGELTGIVLVFRNIEERRTAEREKERVTTQLRQVLGATNDAIVSVNRDWVMTYLNPKASELYASDREILGRVLWEAFPGAVYEGSPYVEHYYRAMNEGIAGAFDAYYPAPLNLWLRLEVYPTPDGIVTYSRDITKEKLAMEELLQRREEAERQRTEIESVYRTAPIGLALFDTKDFRYLRLNNRQAEFFGLTPEEVVGRTLTEMAPIEGLKELFDQVLAGKPVINFPLEGELVTKPGEHRYWTVSYFPVMAADGTVQAITAASLEVTQQKKAEHALIESEKLAVVGRLAASIAHEINNPLESVTNLLYLAGNSGNLDEIKEHIHTAQRELRRASAITSQTLRFHKQSTRPLAVTAQDLLHSVISMYQGRIVNAHLQIEERHYAHEPVRCFEGEIRQVLSNLVNNAIDAMTPGGGRLLLRSRAGTDWSTGRLGLMLTVADTGCGMSPEVLERVFEPFYTTKGVVGTGLGLWVSQEIINRHRGWVQVRSSQRQGHSGTVVTLFLPFDAVDR